MNMKELVGKKAAEYVESGMTVGLGTGSTAYYFVEEIGRRVKEEGLEIVGVTTSLATKKQAEDLGIPLNADYGTLFFGRWQSLDSTRRYYPRLVCPFALKIDVRMQIDSLHNDVDLLRIMYQTQANSSLTLIVL